MLFEMFDLLITGGYGLPGVKGDDKKIVDSIVSEIRRGKVLRRLSLRKKAPNSMSLGATSPTIDTKLWWLTT